MSLKSELLEKLKEIAKNPANEFDRIISANADAFENMNESQLSDIYMFRRRCERLCRLVPYSRDDVSELVNFGDVRPDSRTAELNECFDSAEYIFSKVTDKKF